jgi:hypothetical protein
MVPTAVKKTISLPSELAREAEETARAEGWTLSAMIQDGPKVIMAAGSNANSKPCRGYCRKAKERGILSEEQRRRYLEE